MARVRQRLNTVRDAIGATQADIDGIGRTAREAELLRLNWQSYADLRREAEQNNTSIDTAQLERLKSENSELVRRKELLATRSLEADLGFERRQLGRTDLDQRAASTLRSYGFGDDLDSYEAGLIRLNQQLSLTKDMGSDFASTFVQSFTSGSSAADALTAALGRVADRLLTLATDQVWTTIFKSSSGLLSQVLSPVFGGIGGAGTVGNTTGAIMTNAEGGQIQGPGTGTSDSILSWVSNGEYIVRAAAATRPENRRVLDFINSGGTWQTAPGFAGGGMVGRPSGAPSADPSVNVSVINNVGAEVKTKTSRTPNGGLDVSILLDAVRQIVAEDTRDVGPITQNFAARFGVSPAGGLA